LLSVTEVRSVVYEVPTALYLVLCVIVGLRRTLALNSVSFDSDSHDPRLKSRHLTDVRVDLNFASD
jgi:hypothetical protein